MQGVTRARQPAWSRWLYRPPIKRFAILALALAIGGLALIAVRPAAGQVPALLAQSNPSLEQLQQQQKQLEQQRSRLQQQQQQLQNQQNIAETKLDGLQDTIQATTTQIADTEYRLSQAEKRLKELQVALEVAEREYEKMQRSTVARLQFLQRQQGSQGWAVLLQSENLNEFLDRRRQLKLVYISDRAVLSDLKAKSDDIKRQRTEVEEQKNQVALVRQELLAQKQQFEAQAQQQESLIGRLKQDRSALEAAEAQLARDSEKLAELIRQRIAAATGVVQGTGQFIYPTAGRITSGFGTRVHPILGYRRFHAGVDFGASQGTTIRAADSGTVIFAGWYGGYGRSIIINHGNNLTTLYAHTSEVYVQEGQNVQQGQAIAAVGSTGLSTGPHLHFEVRQNGNPVNPMNYL